MNHKTLLELLKNKFGKATLVGEWINFNCPTCIPHNRNKAKRHININGYISNCFICGVELNVLDLLDGYYIPHISETTEEVKSVNPLSLVLPYTKAIPVNKLPENHPAVQFLYKDELRDLDTYYNLYKIVYVPFEGGMIFNNGKSFITSAERLVFPVYFKSELVGWQMRSLPNTFYGDLKDTIKYYHLFNKGSYLYNYDSARLCDRVIVVEGVKKALKFNNAVATFGCCISKNQLKLIQTWKEVVMMLDTDIGNDNTQIKANEYVAKINAGLSSIAININLAKYGVSSPDDLPSDILNLIVEEEWTTQQH